MNCDQAMDHLKDLRLLKSVYLRLLKDPYKSVFGDNDLKKLIKMTQDEIEELLDFMRNMELEDSYDPNTGKVHRIYTTVSEEAKLLRFCGGPRSEKIKK